MIRLRESLRTFAEAFRNPALRRLELAWAGANLGSWSYSVGIAVFAYQHGGAKAVIEYVGRRGARIVLVGEDGAWGDQFAPGTDVARQACESAGVVVENGWERELIEQVMQLSDNVQVKAAARLGINRNTLHKKLAEFVPQDRAPAVGSS